MDGVIVHSNPAHKQAIQDFCKKYNQDVSHDFLHNRLYGRTNKEWIPELFGDIDADRLKALANEKEQMFRDMFDPEEHIVPGLMTFLDQLRSGNIPIAVATSAPRENADFILSRLSIEPYFKFVLDSSHVDKGKPDPEVYITATAKMDKPAGQCIVLEDSVSGVKAGLGAGCKVIGVTTTHTTEEMSDCHLVIDDFTKLSPDDLNELF